MGKYGIPQTLVLPIRLLAVLLNLLKELDGAKPTSTVGVRCYLKVGCPYLIAAAFLCYSNVTCFLCSSPHGMRSLVGKKNLMSGQRPGAFRR
jgi:hypothetical protein